jgi:hypothetical protein
MGHNLPLRDRWSGDALVNQMKRDQDAIVNALRNMGGSATVADVYLRVGECLGPAINDLVDRRVLVAYRQGTRGSLRIRQW